MFSLVLSESLLHFILNHTDFPVNKSPQKYSSVFLNKQNCIFIYFYIYAPCDYTLKTSSTFSSLSASAIRFSEEFISSVMVSLIS